MADEQRFVTVNVHVRYALWPGDGVFCVRVSAPKIIDTMFLVDREGRRHDLQAYRFGMFEGMR